MEFTFKFAFRSGVNCRMRVVRCANYGHMCGLFACVDLMRLSVKSGLYVVIVRGFRS